MELRWSIEQARRYQLWATYLVGTDYPPGADGVRRCFADLGSVQLDPLPVLGRNHDLVFQARVDHTHPGEALDLIHEQRLGFEYWDKMLCAISLDAFPLFSLLMDAGGLAWERARAERFEGTFPGIIGEVLEIVRRQGPISSRELRTLDVAQQEHRGWKATRSANVALEALWNQGRICVSHRV
ncbi:winged helix DNA-binding domain-containing protein, partial [Candidatus Bipolaricaulota bacterium]|nr:winged helix DNA-binding domain-containing protein [Candidatus Bipolaricaulota bacterium]